MAKCLRITPIATTQATLPARPSNPKLGMVGPQRNLRVIGLPCWNCWLGGSVGSMNAGAALHPGCVTFGGSLPADSALA